MALKPYSTPGLLPADNPISQWVAPRRNALLGFGAGMLSNNWSDIGTSTMQGMKLDRDYAKEAQELEQQNVTMEWVREKYPQYANMAPEQAFDMAFRAEAAKLSGSSPIEVNGQLVNPTTGEVIGDYRDPQPTGPDPDKLFGMEKDLAAQYGGQDPVKTYQAVRNGYERVRASATENSGAGDISMIFAYMKMLDPTSVVREGEFATAETAGGAGEQIANLYNRVLSGERLTPELRKEFLAAADKLYQESSQNLSALNEQYTTRAGAWGVDPTRFVVSPETYQPLGGAGARTTSTGVNWSF